MRRINLLILGDSMVDYYHIGEISRLNPEKGSAPLVAVSKTASFPGGAANVERNAIEMLASTTLISGAGNIQKHRIVTKADGVICRYDMDGEIQPIALNKAAILVGGYDAIVVSDYGKGSIDSSVRSILAEVPHPLFIDTKQDPDGWFGRLEKNQKDVWFFPNEKEYCKYKRQYQNARNLVLKKGGRGADVVVGGTVVASSAANSTLVVNPAGAGDTVLAAFTVGYLALTKMNAENASYGDDRSAPKYGIPPERAIGLAMSLAGVAVRSLTTAAPNFNNLLNPTGVESAIYQFLMGGSAA